MWDDNNRIMQNTADFSNNETLNQIFEKRHIPYTSSQASSCSESIEVHLPKWQSFIKNDGSLFYAEYNNSMKSIPKFSNSLATETGVFPIQNTTTQSNNRRRFRRKSKTATKLTKSGGNKFKDRQEFTKGGNKVESSVVMQTTAKTVELYINPADRHKFGRRSKAIESMLGLKTVALGQNDLRLLVIGYTTNFEINNQQIKVGDRLKSINGTEINAINIEEMLIGIDEPSMVRIILEREIAGSDALKRAASDLIVCGNFSEFVNKMTTNQDYVQYEMYLVIFSGLSFGNDDIIYTYPDECEDFVGICGSFLTLQSIIRNEFSLGVSGVCLTIRGRDFYVSFRTINTSTILLAIPAASVSQEEFLSMAEVIIKYFSYFYPSLSNHLSNQVTDDLNGFCKMMCFTSKRITHNLGLLQCDHVVIPKELELNLADELNDMKAQDYRMGGEHTEIDWNTNKPMIFIGCAVFFHSNLIYNELSSDFLERIQTYLLCRGILHFTQRQEDHFLLSCSELPETVWNRRLILIIGSLNQLAIATTLEGFQLDSRQIAQQMTAYVEEIQMRLRNLQNEHTMNLLNSWIQSNKRPEIYIGSVVDDTDGHLNEMSTLEQGLDTKTISSLENSSVKSASQSEVSQIMRGYDSDVDDLSGSVKSSSIADHDTKALFTHKIHESLPYRLTAGDGNSLFWYRYSDPLNALAQTPANDWQNEMILTTFANVGLLIRATLNNTKKLKKSLLHEATNPKAHKYLVAIKEHGVLIAVTNEKNRGNHQGIRFWNIGRLFASTGRELYLCHNANNPQNLVEIAFRLSYLFGG